MEPLNVRLLLIGFTIAIVFSLFFRHEKNISNEMIKPSVTESAETPEPAKIEGTAETDPEAYDFGNDPIGLAFFGQIKPIARTVLEQWEQNRRYSSADFPLSIEAHNRFSSELRAYISNQINSGTYIWENEAQVSSYYDVDLIETLSSATHTLNLYRLTVHQTSDQVPLVICVPKTDETTLPGVILFSGHTSNSGLYDLFIDEEGYQKAMALRLCKREYLTIAVEKLDSGYTTIRFQELGKNSVVEREPGGGADDELEVATTIINTGGMPIFGRQLIANLAAYDFFLSHPSLNKNKVGSSGVSFGGWQAVHLMLLRDNLTSISNFGGMWSYLETHMARENLSDFEGVADFSQSFPGIFRFGDQNRFVFAIAGRRMQIGYGENDKPYVKHRGYFHPLLREQYQVLRKENLLEEVTHQGGHEFSPADVISYFDRTLK